MNPFLAVTDEIEAALPGGPVVALETTVISYGLPYPQNLTAASDMESAVRRGGAIPAAIALIGRKVRVGLTREQYQELATSQDVRKVSRRDIGPCLALGRTGATTVAATMYMANLTGIRVFATGGIGGVHRALPGAAPIDVSADLPELARTPVCVVCSGAKSILDLPATLEWLETWGVPVIGYGVDELPAFCVRSSGLRLVLRADSAAEVAAICRAHWQLGLGGVVVAVPIPEADALPAKFMESATGQALNEALRQLISGAATTPFVLKRLAELTEGATLGANLALLRNNAAVAASIAVALSG